MRTGLRVLSRENLGKLGRLLRDHRPRQIANTLRYGLDAVRGFPRLELPYDPLWLALLITRRCNLGCLQCPVHCPESNPAATEDMSIELFDHLLARFPGSIAVSISGGEPLLHPRLFEMIERAAARRLKVHIPTNGTLIPRMVDDLLRSPVEMLNVSLYGTDRESFREHTGARAELFDATVEGVAELAARRRRFGFPRLLRLSFICTATSLAQAQPFVRLAERIGVDQVKLKNVTPFRVTRYATRSCLFDDDLAVREALDGLEAGELAIPVYLPRLFRRDGDARDCTMPFRLLTIDGAGSVAPCCVRGTDHRWGTIGDDPGPWNGRVLKAARRRALDAGRTMPFLCRHCEENIGDRPHIGGQASP